VPRRLRGRSTRAAIRLHTPLSRGLPRPVARTELKLLPNMQACGIANTAATTSHASLWLDERMTTAFLCASLNFYTIVRASLSGSLIASFQPQSAQYSRCPCSCSIRERARLCTLLKFRHEPAYVNRTFVHTAMAISSHVMQLFFISVCVL
jgi:hypothetical protein